MSAYADLFTLLFGLAGVLLVASGVGYVLQKRYSPDGSNPVIENLNDRIYAWWAMVALIGLALISVAPAPCSCSLSPPLPPCVNSSP